MLQSSCSLLEENPSLQRGNEEKIKSSFTLFLIFNFYFISSQCPCSLACQKKIFWPHLSVRCISQHPYHVFLASCRWCTCPSPRWSPHKGNLDLTLTCCSPPASQHEAGVGLLQHPSLPHTHFNSHLFWLNSPDNQNSSALWKLLPPNNLIKETSGNL